MSPSTFRRLCEATPFRRYLKALVDSIWWYGILLVTHYFHLIEEEGEDFSQSMILRGSLERLAPVLMTAITAIMGLLPIVVGGQKPGLEILYPVATVIVGGLLTSTFCEFLIHPGLFWKFSGKDALRRSAARWTARLTPVTLRKKHTDTNDYYVRLPTVCKVPVLQAVCQDI